MKNILILFCLTACISAYAQDSLKTFNYNRYHVTTSGMTVLAGWGAVNLGVGAAGWASAHGTNKYFYEMDTFWGAANLGIVLLGYSGAKKNEGSVLTPAGSLKEQQKIEKIFLINGGFDFVYIGTGIFLKVRGDDRNSAELKGYGSSVILQGIFLLIFDTTMYSANRSNGNKLRRFLEKNPVTFNGRSIGFIYYL